MADAALSIAASGLEAAQVAMDTISQNLANVNTPGYLAQTADLVTNPGGDPLGVGDGVRVADVGQAGDSLLMVNAQQAQGAQSYATATQQVLQSVQSAFPDLSSGGLSSDLSSFWQSWDAVAQNPTDPTAREGVIASAQTVVSDLHQLNQQLTTMQANTQSQLSGAVGQSNVLLQQLATLNKQIVTTIGSGESANSLIDQRNQVMSQLAQAIGAVGVPQGDGTMNVTVAGTTFTPSTTGNALTLSTSGGTETLSLNGAPANLTSGTVAGLLVTLTPPSASSGPAAPSIPGFLSQLDTVANDLINTVNPVLESGYTASGAAGTALFSGTGAAGISVAITNPTDIAAATNPSAAANDGSNAQALADLYNSPTGPDQAYRSLFQNIGSATQAADNQVQAQTAVANAAEQNLQAIAGVNSDSQLVNLMNFQQAYQASAKVISTVDTAIQSLLSAV